MKNWKVTKDNVKNLLGIMDAMAGKMVYVGVPGEATDRGEPINNATIGYIQENGSPAANIPARPHLVPGVQDALPAVTKILQVAAEKALAPAKGNKPPVSYDQRLERAGFEGVKRVKRRITSQEGFEALADSTLAARERAGFKGTKALIRSGQYLNSINHVVRSK